MARSISQGVRSQEVRRHCEAMALIPKGLGASFLFYTGLSTGHGTCTRLPHETQVASRKYQTSSKSSKQAITLNTSQPQLQTWTGPRDRRSVPKGPGRLGLFFNRRSRRNHTQNRSARALRASRFGGATALTRPSLLRLANARIVLMTGVSYQLRHAVGIIIH